MRRCELVARSLHGEVGELNARRSHGYAQRRCPLGYRAHWQVNDLTNENSRLPAARRIVRAPDLSSPCADRVTVRRSEDNRRVTVIGDRVGELPDQGERQRASCRDVTRGKIVASEHESGIQGAVDGPRDIKRARHRHRDREFAHLYRGDGLTIQNRWLADEGLLPIHASSYPVASWHQAGWEMERVPGDELLADPPLLNGEANDLVRHCLGMILGIENVDEDRWLIVREGKDLPAKANAMTTHDRAFQDERLAKPCTDCRTEPLGRHRIRPDRSRIAPSAIGDPRDTLDGRPERVKHLLAIPLDDIERRLHREGNRLCLVEECPDVGLIEPVQARGRLQVGVEEETDARPVLTIGVSDIDIGPIGCPGGIAGQEAPCCSKVDVEGGGHGRARRVVDEVRPNRAAKGNGNDTNGHYGREDCRHYAACRYPATRHGIQASLTAAWSSCCQTR